MAARELRRPRSPRHVFGRMVRYHREKAGMSRAALAAAICKSASLVEAIECGDRVGTENVTADLDHALGLGGDLVALRAEMAEGLGYQGVPAWFEDWVKDIETAAATLRWFEPLLVPGLLQTESYARALYATRVGLGPDDVDALVAARLGRQQILLREVPPMLWVMLDEGVLRRPVGGRDVMAELVGRLYEAAQRPKVRVEIVPAAIGAHDGLTGAFIVADVPGRPAAGYREGAREGQVVTDHEQVSDLMTCWDTLRAEALSRSESLALLEEAAKSWT